MATLSDAIKEHGFVNDGFVCDECHNVLLYWDRAKGEFWGRGADPKQHYPVGSEKANGWLQSFLQSTSVRLYKPEPKKPKETGTKWEERMAELEKELGRQQKRISELEYGVNREIRGKIADLENHSHFRRSKKSK